MKEIRGIIAEFERADQTGQNTALATVFDVRGSSYRRSGARMLIRSDGNWFGGISGGCIEGNALKQANLVMADKKARIVTYDTANDDSASIGVSLGCNGVISVIIAPVSEDTHLNPMHKLREIIDTREALVLITILESIQSDLSPGYVISSNELDLLNLDNDTTAEIRHAIKNVLINGKSRIIENSSLKMFLEFIEPEIQLIVMGGNYDVLPILALADNLGWNKTVVTIPQRLFPPAKRLADQVSQDINEVTIDSHSVAIIMSHDYQADLNNLRQALTTELPYIGLLGPAVRRNDMLQELRDEGIIVDESCIFGPAGLDIGAMQPEEIALSILAEIIAVKRNRSAQSLREREQPIHERESASRAEVK